ncbi:hypothetical protein PVE90_18485 [Pseudomonas carnis]|nr:hypothetical protein [Pseudomonas carnis]
MADLPESNEWAQGVYQLETSDPVLGGPEGIDNLQAKQLANRTKWLKDQVEKIINGAITIGKAVQLATARTFTLSGAATGSASFDGSANANILVTLANSGVAAGTYPKVQVNAKGLVTGGTSLSALDIPSLDWTKIGSGKPTTLGGFGITDALSNSGGDVTGTINLMNARSITTVATDSTSWAGGLNAVSRVSREILSGFGAWGNGDTVHTVYMGLSSVPWQFGYGVRVKADGVYISGPITGNGTGLSGIPWSGLTGVPTSLAGYGVQFASQQEAETGADTNKPMSALRVFQAIVARVIQATESVAGIARVATQVSVNAGVDDTTFVTPKKLKLGFFAVWGETGGIVFPTWLGGLIINWGISGSTLLPGASTQLTMANAFTTSFFKASAFYDGSDSTAMSTFNAYRASMTQIKITNTHATSTSTPSYIAIGR